jgi:hypothetical protein
MIYIIEGMLYQQGVWKGISKSHKVFFPDFKELF